MLKGLMHKEAHPVIPDLHWCLFKGSDTSCIHRTLLQVFRFKGTRAWK